jgi:FemAB-related protein (PEP-CTERM system-associated)
MPTEAMKLHLVPRRAVTAQSKIIVSAAPSIEAWNRFVATKGASGYHAWEWRGVFERAFGHDTIYLAALRDGLIEGILPLVLIDSWLFGRGLFSLPFLNYGGVVAVNDAVARALLAEASSIAKDRNCRSLELRHTTPQFTELPSKRHKVAMLLPLADDSERMWNALDRKVRNQIRKAQKSELSAEVGGLELLDDFYRVFARNMRDLGTPVYGRRLFAEVLTTFPMQARIHVVRRAGAAIAAGISYRTRSTVEVPWASSLREHNSLCPNHLLYWSIIEHAIGERCTSLDFGRSTPHEVTFKFKEQWGATPRPCHWEYYLPSGQPLPNTSPTNPKFSLAIAAWKKLPVGLATWLGPSIVRGIP